MNNLNSILLKGLDGSNPLAFLAALGTLRTLILAFPGETVNMSWEHHEGAWRPRVWCSLPADDDALIETLDKSLARQRASHPTRFVNYKSGNEEAIEFYKSVRQGTSIPTGFDQWIVALTNDVHPEATSPIQLTRSDYFVGNLDQIMANTTQNHLRLSLFTTWRYDDPLAGQSLHLEPTEDRRHAYQWDRPSGDPNRNKSGNMLGANRLAIEAIPLFLGLPSTNPARMLLTGWTGVRSDDSRWTWPIWEHPISLGVVCSTLSLPELQAETPTSDELRRSGISSAFRCRRILVEKTPNLTPPFALW
jgi:CRISPR-associated endonuclease/helicase Cas3